MSAVEGAGFAVWRTRQSGLLESVRDFLLELERSLPVQDAWRLPALELRLRVDREIEALREASHVTR
jgi:hypothetical protein